MAYDPHEPVLFAAAVVMDAANSEVLEQAAVRGEARFPYLPGYLSFRELPGALQAVGALRRPPDLLLADGHGRAHPRRFGLACHLGVLLDLPTIGCAKSRLVGTHEPVGARRGAHRPLLDAGERVGDVLRTQDDVRPIYVSVGHRVSLGTARAIALELASPHRIPEPIRLAHAEVTRLRATAGS